MIVYTWDHNGIKKITRLHEIGYKFKNLIFFGAHELDYSSFVCGKQNGILDLINIAEQHNIPLHIITGSTKETPLLLDANHLKNCVIHYHENFWLTITHLELLKTTKVSMNSNLLYKVVCLNFKPRMHRCLIMDLLSKYNLINENAITWHQTLSINGPIEVLNYPFQYWIPKTLTLQESSEFNSYAQYFPPIEYENSFCQLVTESCDSIPIVSEKTSVPLFYMKPFLVAGCQNYHKILQRMGFKLYDEIFDYSFDDLSDISLRYNLLVQNLVKVNSLSFEELEKIQNSLKEKLLHNRNNAIALATKLSNQPVILKKIFEETRYKRDTFDQEFNEMFTSYV